jgi:hypothetical protein
MFLIISGHFFQKNKSMKKDLIGKEIGIIGIILSRNENKICS